MATVSGPPSGATRNKPIQQRLRDILSGAADAVGVDHVRISSGGQDARGKGRRRTGSTRHDVDASGHGGAADLELLVGGRVLNFETGDRETIARFVTECSRRGATGIGAGGRPGSGSYMGPTKLHIGFGVKATWGGDKARSADAPSWLKAAVAAASSAPVAFGTLRRGDKGKDVKALQTKLGITADGDFGPATEEAVKAFQSRHFLNSDGIVGPATRAALGL